MGIDEEGSGKVNGATKLSRKLVQNNLELLESKDIENLESRITSVSSAKHKAAKSLVTVLSQSLTADDTETIDWILA
jgi:hypothetical protein